MACQGPDRCVRAWEWGGAGGGSALVNGLPASVAAEQLMLAMTCWFFDSTANVRPCSRAG